MILLDNLSLLSLMPVMITLEVSVHCVCILLLLTWGLKG